MVPPKVRWATSNDWAAVRDIVTELYAWEGMSLQALMQWMRENHNFHATAKMYKYRFKIWGVRKNFKSSEIDELLANNSHEHVQAHSRCQPARDGRIISASHDKEPPGRLVPYPSHLATPDCLRIPEECIRFSRDYIDSRVWQYSIDKNAFLREWYGTFARGESLLAAGMVQDAFSHFQRGFSQTADGVAGQDPSFFVWMYSAAMTLFESAPEVAKSLITYTAHMCRVTHGPHHPLSLLLSRMNRMDIHELVKGARQVLESYFQYLESSLDSAKECDLNATLVILQVRTTDLLVLRGLLDMQVADELFQRNLGKIRCLPRATFHLLKPIQRYVASAHEESVQLIMSPEQLFARFASGEILSYSESLAWCNLVPLVKNDNQLAPSHVSMLLDQFASTTAIFNSNGYGNYLGKDFYSGFERKMSQMGCNRNGKWKRSGFWL
ncbi:Clr5 domain-containing protein [Pseudomassariella vexata]|uniref:Clr5 domain-domain-containing protein n=1 Tax=Pseudomassariella vexata TaxID=1141098 RepID=A0A1Y2DVT1_9PEZI|nr:Clr5 domain-containing protein [Pseudomassariella vexata]ORY63367.1 Clr5 domain-domain-containing protein [Pseudomassariella vexata]